MAELNLKFDEGTDPRVEAVLRSLIHSRERVRIWYGDQESGRVWDEEYDVMGRIGFSTGIVKIPLIVHNARSIGGPALMTRCILRIQSTETGRILYQHERFEMPVYKVSKTGTEDHPFRVLRLHDGPVAAFTNETITISSDGKEGRLAGVSRNQDETDIGFDASGDEVSMSLNAKYLIDALSFYSGETVIGFNDTQLVIDGDYRSVVMCVRV